MFADLSKSSHYPVVPVYSSTVPHGLSLRVASPVNRMTITGAPSGVAPVPVAHPVVTRTSPDAFLAATRASYQENPRQVCSCTARASSCRAPARTDALACCCLTALGICLSRPWTPSSVGISTLVAAAFRRWARGDCRCGHRDIVGRTSPSSAPRCFWARRGESESTLSGPSREEKYYNLMRIINQQRLRRKGLHSNAKEHHDCSQEFPVIQAGPWDVPDMRRSRMTQSCAPHLSDVQQQDCGPL